MMQAPREAEPEETEPQEAKQEEPGVRDAEAREEQQLMEDLDRQQEGPSEHGMPLCVSATGSARTSHGIVMTSRGLLPAALPQESDYLETTIKCPASITPIANMSVQGTSQQRP